MKTKNSKTTAAPALPYTIRKFQEWEGMDGMGCRGEIVHETAGRVASFFDEGCGGELMLDRLRHPNGKIKAGLEDFKTWANASDAIQAVFKHWGFERSQSCNADVMVEVLIGEHRIAKDVKRGYLVVQTEKDGPCAHATYRQNRKKVRYSEANEAWVRANVEGATVRNTNGPTWL